jgi:carbohydrate kinase (thermoresistant glucokinase family)
MDARAAAGESAAVACSALKRAYRDLLREGRSGIAMVLLDGSRDLLAGRLAARHGHFFDQRLLASQLADQELPQPGEDMLVLPVTMPPEQIVAEIIARFGLPAPPGPGRQ